MLFYQILILDFVYIFRNLSIHFLEENIKHTLSNKAVVIDAIRIEFIVS